MTNFFNNFWNEFIALWGQPGYIASQILVLFGLVCMAITYQTKNKMVLLIAATISSVFYGAHYYILGSLAGAMVNAVSILRNLTIYFYSRKDQSVPLWALLILIGIFLGLGIVTMKQWYDIFSIIASIVYTLMLNKVNIKVYRWAALFHSALWITYSILMKTVVGTISECTLLIIEIIGIIRLYSGKNKNINKA